MIRGLSLLVTLLTLLGVVLMIGCFSGFMRPETEGPAELMLMIVSAIGALIATVGLSASMIVSAIRDQPQR